MTPLQKEIYDRLREYGESAYGEHTAIHSDDTIKIYDQIAQELNIDRLDVEKEVFQMTISSDIPVYFVPAHYPGGFIFVEEETL